MRTRGWTPAATSASITRAASARWARDHTTFGRDVDLPGLVDEFAWTIRRELDYLREAQNVERFRRMFRNDPRVHVPRVHSELTTSRVLTLERMAGIKISDGPALAAAQPTDSG